MNKKVLCAFLCICSVLLIYNVSCVEAAINEDYYDQSIEGMEVVDAALDDKLSSSTALELIGHAVYSIGCLMEWLLKAVFQSTTATNVFPWADAVVFNAVPFLDANFINPDSRSLLAQIGMTGGIIPKMYSTIFSLSVAFFGVSVMIVALKLLISTVAEQKAKYKQALMQWFIGLGMLYTIHFFMSFVLYLNEQLVQIASEIVDASTVNISLPANPNTDKQIVNNYIADKVGNDKSMDDYSNIKNNIDISLAFIQCEEYRNLLDNIALWKHVGLDIKESFNNYSMPIFLDDIANMSTLINSGATETKIKETANEAYNSLITNLHVSVQPGIYEDVYLDVFNILKNGNQETTGLFSTLAEYFKKSAWSYDENSYIADKVVVQNSFLYTIFVVQSVIFFVAYIKRLVYIIILGMLGPLAVVTDFIKKT